MKEASRAPIAPDTNIRRGPWPRSRTQAGAAVRRRPSKHLVFTCGDVEADVDERMIRVRGKHVVPTYGEFELPLRLSEDPGRVVPR